MEENWKIYNSGKEWEKDGKSNDCYYPNEIKFDIICKKCGAKAILYYKDGGAYDYQNTIKCNKCGNEKELYGCDG